MATGLALICKSARRLRRQFYCEAKDSGGQGCLREGGRWVLSGRELPIFIRSESGRGRAVSLGRRAVGPSAPPPDAKRSINVGRLDLSQLPLQVEVFGEGHADSLPGLEIRGLGDPDPTAALGIGLTLGI